MLGKFDMNLGFWASILAAYFFAAPLCAAEEESKNPVDELQLPDVVARINETEIRSNFIKFKFNSVLKSLRKQSGGLPVKFKKVKKIEIVREIIDKEVIRELMYQAAKTTGIQLDSELMEKEMVKLMKVMGGEEKYYSSLKKRNIDPAIIRHDMEMQFLIHDLIKEQIEGKIDITDAEVKMLYDTNIDKFKRPKSFHTRHILIPHFSRKDLNDVGKDDMGEKQRELSEQSMKKAQKILAELQGGADFEALAKEYSKDEESANKGGDLSFIYKGIFPPEFDDAVEKLKPQEISDVVTTVAGHHIIQLIETRPPDTAPFKEVEQGIQQFLFMQNGKKHLEQYVEKLRQRANVEVLY